MSHFKILALPGDGIGQEVMTEALRIIDWFNTHSNITLEVELADVGGTAYDIHGHPAPDTVIEMAKASDAILLGAVGGPKWSNVPRHLRPEVGLLALRKELNLFANLRPAICYPELISASTLRPEFVSGLDILIVRELTGGVYFGQPRGIEDLDNSEKRAVDTQVYDTREIRRIAHIGFTLAQQRGGKLCSVEKANVMETGLLWRETVSAMADQYADVSLSHMYADNCAMQLVRQPKQFDVIVTDNLFGDILSDCAAMLSGSLGMLPSASLGKVGIVVEKGGAMYEPVHGSAPDIAGKGIANPLAMILSFGMCLRYSFECPAEASHLEQAVRKTLADGIRTADLCEEGGRAVSTSQMGQAVLERLES